MTTKELYEICCCLSPFQWDHVAFLAKHKGKECLNAITYVKQLTQDRQNDNILLNDLHQHVYPQYKYRTVRIQKLIDEVIDIVQSVVAIESFQLQPQAKFRLFMIWLIEKGMVEIARNHYNWLQFTSKTTTNLSMRNLSDLTLSYIEFYWIDLRTKNSLEEQTANEILIQVQYFLIVQALTIQLSLVSLKRTQAKEYPFTLGEVIYDTLGRLNHFNQPLIRLLQLAILIQSEKATLEDKTEYEELLDQNIPLLGQKMGNLLFLLKVNYQIYHYNKNHSKENLNALFQTYQTMWEKDILLWGNSLSYFSYLNITNIALSCDAIDWAEKFIDTFKMNVPEEFRESSYNFNKASIEFKKGNYKTALEYNIDVTFKNTNAFYASKRLMIKTFYLLQEWKALSNTLETLKRYMNRKEDNSYHSDQRKNFIKNIRLLLKMATSIELSKRKPMLNKIKAQSSTDHDWILEQATALQDSK